MSLKHFLLFYVSVATKLVEYRLAYNYGQVFHDFSGNSRDGVNGLSSATTAGDTVPTDRGASFDSCNNVQITLPSNNQVSSAFTLPPTFTIACWFISREKEAGQMFYRYKDSSNYFIFTHVEESSTATLQIVISGISSGVQTTPTGAFNNSK